MGIVLRASGFLAAVVILPSVALAQAPSPTPDPGAIGAFARFLSGAATWLGARAAEYGGNPLLPTVVAVLLIILFVVLMAWLRRPKKPLDTHLPM